MIDQVAKGISVLNFLASIALSSPELKLSDEEAKALSEASLNVAAWYMPVEIVAGPIGAWWALIMVLVTIYGPRVISITRRKRSPPAPRSPILREEPVVAPEAKANVEATSTVQ